MHTKVPSPVRTPEVSDIEQITEKLESKIKKIQNSLVAHASKLQPSGPKAETGTQTSALPNMSGSKQNSTIKDSQNEISSDVNEQKYVELQKKYDSLLLEMKKIDEANSRRKNVANSVEDHYTKIELELFAFKKQTQTLEDDLTTLKNRNQNLKEKIEELEKSERTLRNEANLANSKANSNKTKLQELGEEVYRATLN